MVTNVSTTQTNTLLEVKHLSVEYLTPKGSVHAVNDVSFTLERGQILGVVGESGSGKSTLAYAIARLHHPPAVISGGEVWYHPRSEGEDEHGRNTQSDVDEPIDILKLTSPQLRAFRWSELAVVFQSAMNALNPVMTIEKQITDVMKIHQPSMGEDSRRSRAIELLNLVGISRDRLRSYPHELSGGMRQRATIAIALALNPDLIIMDEPTTALDVVVQRDILMQIMELRKEFGFSVIFITHDLSLLLEMADRLIIMYAGRIVETADRRELYARPQHPYTHGLLNSFPSLHGPHRIMHGIPGSPPDLRAIPSGCAFHPRCAFAFNACSQVVPALYTPRGARSEHQVACLLYNEKFHPAGPPERLDRLEDSESVERPVVSSEQNGALEQQPRPVLEAANLRMYFPVRGGKLFGPSKVVHAVEDFSLALKPGHTTALVGESGSGKTTVARLLARIYNPTDGEIRFQGEPAKATRGAALRAYRRHVQLIFQDPFSSFNAVHDIRYHLSRPLRIHGHARSDGEVDKQIKELLARVSLSPASQFMYKYPHQLSGGQRQRIAIARALAARPSVLLADEPISMLDVSIRLDILNLLLRLKDEEQLALLYITHDIASARYFAEDTLVMYAGQMVEGGPSDEVILRPKHPYTQLLLAAAPDPDRIKTVPGEERENEDPWGVSIAQSRGEPPSLIEPPRGCRFHPRCPHAMPICREQVPARTELGPGHWTNCFLYSEQASAQAGVPIPLESVTAKRSVAQEDS